MWPDPGEALSRHMAAEAAVEDLYAEALRRWHPTLKAAVLPALTAATLPPNPEAAQEQAGDEWLAVAATVVVGGAALLWAASAIEAMLGMGIPLPPLPAMRADRQRVIDAREVAMADTTVVRTVLKALDEVNVTELADMVDLVESSPVLAAARDEFVEHQRERVAELPAAVAAKVELAATQATQMAQDAGVAPEVRQSDVRTAVAATVDPAGDAMREIARTAGYQAAAVQNHAVVSSAQLGETEDDPLDKVWIATMDGKTRPSHWAADGQRAPLAGTFTVGGEAMAFPADPAASARERKNCRCRVGVLGRDEQLPSEVDRHTERLNGRDAVQINRQGSQQDEIDRRSARGNVRARDTADGIGTVASGGWTAPSEQEYTMAPKTTTLAADDDTEAGTEQFRTFTDAVIALVGEPTSDGRMLAKDIDLSMRTFPHPLMWCKQSKGAHDDSYTIGVIESARMDKGKVFGSGYLLNTPEADEAANELAHGVTSPSVDLASSEWIMTDKDGAEVEYEDYIKSLEDGDPIELYTTVISAELIGTTLVATAAFGDTQLTLNPERESREVPLVASVVASFQPRVYPAAFFREPETSVPVRSTITEDGRVFGYIAAWDEQHRSVGLGNITPPRSTTGYREFHTSPPVRLDDGTELAVGRLTVGIGHAATVGVSAAEAAAHYDNADACWALVRVGENHMGIWFSGVAAPWAAPEQVEKGLAAPLSGDWRDYGMGLELVAALAVNTPGFNVRGATDASGRELAMVASLAPVSTTPAGVQNFTADDLADIVGRAVTTALAKREADTELAGLLAQADQITRPPTPAEAISEMLEGRA